MSELERYLDDLGERLHAAPDPARPRRRLTIGATAAAAAAALAAVVLLATGGVTHRIDAVAEARAALAPAGEIVHMVIRTEHSGRLKPTTAEQWSAADPLRWRVVQQLAKRGERRRMMVMDADGPIYGREEFSYGAGEQRTYLAERNTLLVQRGFGDGVPEPGVPSLFGEGGGDPETDLRALLASGQFADAGEVQARGRTVRRLVSEQGRRRLVYDVDPDTFAPLQGSISFSVRGEPPATIRFVVDRYERIPITVASAKLLTIRTNARTKVTVRSGADLRRRARLEREWTKSCVKRPGGDSRCPPPPPGLLPTPVPRNPR